MDEELPRGRGGISALLPDSGNPGCGWRRILSLRENSKLEDFSLKPSELIPCLLTINTTRLISLEIQNTGRTPVLNLYSLGFSLAERCAKLTEWVHTVPHKVGTTISPTTTKLEKDGRKLRQAGSSGIDDGAISRALLYIHPAGTYLVSSISVPPSCQSRHHASPGGSTQDSQCHFPGL